ncbi:TIR domain-containing protein [Modestobacter sp. SYSU DS0875]
MSDQHNVFISHRHEDDALIADLKDLVARHGADVRDSSINAATPNQAKDPDYIKSILAERIRWAGKIIVIVSPQTKDHEWVDWEIEYANKLDDKRIIGVWAPDATGCELPEPLQRHADAIVPWNGEKIVDALDGTDNWEDPDGSPHGGYAISRIGC